MADQLKAAESDIRLLRNSESAARAARGAADQAKTAAEEKARVAEEAAKEAAEVAKAAEEAAKVAKDRWIRAEDWALAAQGKAEAELTSRLEVESALKKAQEELAAARGEHQRYIDVALPAAREDARAEALAEYLESEEFKARLASEYQDGMRDMKACFIDRNPSLVGVDWSFVPSWSEETATEEPMEEGEVSGPVPVPEDVVVVDEPTPPEVPEQAAAPEQPPPVQPTSPGLDITMVDLFPDQLD